MVKKKTLLVEEGQNLFGIFSSPEVLKASYCDQSPSVSVRPLSVYIS